MKVTADPTATDDQSKLPPESAYTSDNLLGSIKSPKFSAIAELVLKISHNEVANLTVCLMAVKLGSKNCTDGFKPIRERTKKLGITPQETWFVDGAGGGDASTTAGAITKWIDWIDQQPYGASFPKMLPSLGVDGSIGMLGKDSPAKGKIQAKTGTTAALDASNGRLLIRSKALAGYMQAKDGTPYYFALYMNGGNFDEPEGPVHRQQGPGRRRDRNPAEPVAAIPRAAAQAGSSGRIGIDGGTVTVVTAGRGWRRPRLIGVAPDPGDPACHGDAYGNPDVELANPPAALFWAA